MARCKRVAGIVLSALCVWAGLIACRATGLPSAHAIVAQLRTAEQQPFHAVIEATLNDKAPDVVELWVKDDQHIRMQYRESPFLNLRGVRIVRNADTAWRYDPDQDVYYQTTPDDELITSVPSFAPARIQESVEYMVARMDFTLLGTEVVAGRPTYKLQAVATKEQEAPYSIQAAMLWVDTETWHVLGLETVSRYNGDEATSALMTREIEYAPDLSDELFSVPQERVRRQPETASLSLAEARQAVEFPLLTPGYLPEGFEFQQAQVIPTPQGTVVNLVYRHHDTSRGLSIMQKRVSQAPAPSPPSTAEGQTRTISVRGRQATLAQFSDQRHAIRWQEGGVEITINAALSEEELLKVAESLAYQQ